jgi:hypothetical protein
MIQATAKLAHLTTLREVSYVPPTPVLLGGTLCIVICRARVAESHGWVKNLTGIQTVT